ncbi:hypothetical protein BaRGS_00001319, partial [Batillaria attramentaria]
PKITPVLKRLSCDDIRRIRNIFEDPHLDVKAAIAQEFGNPMPCVLCKQINILPAKTKPQQINSTALGAPKSLLHPSKPQTLGHSAVSDLDGFCHLAPQMSWREQHAIQLLIQMKIGESISSQRQEASSVEGNPVSTGRNYR